MKKRKIFSVITALALTSSLTANAFAASVSVDSVLSDNEKITGVTLTANENTPADVYIASYLKGELQGISLVKASQLNSGEQVIYLSTPIAKGDENRVFVWSDGMTPLSDVLAESPTPTETPEQSPTPTEIPEQSPTPTETPEQSPTPTETPTSTETPTPTETPIPACANIVLADSNIISDSDYGVVIDNENSTVTLTKAGTYTISGSLTDGQILVNSDSKDDKLTVNLNSVSVSCSDNAPFCGTKGKVDILLSGENTFTDLNTTETLDRENACVFNKHDLSIKPQSGVDSTPSFTVKAAYSNGIRTKKDLEVGAVDINVISQNGNGIKGDESVKFTKKAKNVNITSAGDAIKSDYLPEVVDGVTEGGTVTINGGVFTIDAKNQTDGSTSDGIQADLLLEINGGTINITATGEGLKANASTIEKYVDSTDTSADDGCINISGGTVTISAGEDGVKATKDVSVSGGTLTITKSADGIQAGSKITALDLGTGTDDETAVYAVNGSVYISGGEINVTSSEDGIHSGTENVIITDGSVTTVSATDGIQAENILYIENGAIDVKAGGGHKGNTNTSVSYSCKGLKGGKLVKLTGGTINVDSLDDSIHSNDTVRISGGNITVAADDDGVHGDNFLYISDNAYINVTASYEGIEAAEIYISGGETYVVSSDDGANAAGEKPTTTAQDFDLSAETASADLMAGGGWNQGPTFGGDDTSSYGFISVTGGLLFISAEGDGFDSNGSAEILGGTVFVNGPTSGGNGVFDIGDSSGSTLTMKNATVIGAGTSDMAVTPNSSDAYIVTGGSSGGGGNRPGSSTGTSGVSGNAGSVFTVIDGSGNEVVTYKPSKKYSWIFVMTPEMTANTSYTLKTGGTYSLSEVTQGINGFGMLKSGGTYSGGTSTSLSSVTK